MTRSVTPSGSTRDSHGRAETPDLGAVTTLRDEIERLCLDSYELGATEAVATLVQAFRNIGMDDAARMAESAAPRLKVPHV